MAPGSRDRVGLIMDGVGRIRVNYKQTSNAPAVEKAKEIDSGVTKWETPKTPPTINVPPPPPVINVQAPTFFPPQQYPSNAGWFTGCPFPSDSLDDPNTDHKLLLEIAQCIFPGEANLFIANLPNYMSDQELVKNLYGTFHGQYVQKIAVFHNKRDGIDKPYAIAQFANRDWAAKAIERNRGPIGMGHGDKKRELRMTFSTASRTIIVKPVFVCAAS